MRLRNGEHGYGVVTKALHWLTVGAITAQLVVGYTMDRDGDAADDVDCDPPGEDRSGGDTTDAGDDALDRAEDTCEARQDAREETDEDGVGQAWTDLGDGSLLDGGLSLPELHVLLGLGILALAVVRTVWRSSTPLPPWAPALSAGERRLEAVLEKALLALLYVVPATGLLLVAGEDDWLPLHVAAHVAFYVTLALHVGLVLRHTVVSRDRHLQRML